MIKDKSEAWLNGWTSHKSGYSSEDNPYNEETQFASHFAWMMGWSTRHETSVNETLDMDDKVLDRIFR